MPGIQIRGVDKIIHKLGLAAATKTLESPMQRSVLRLQRDLQQYPPQDPASAYVRTGSLGRRWTTRVSSSASGLTGRVGNNIRYGPWVQSQRFQTVGHRRTGWETDQGAVDRNEKTIVDDFQAAIDRALAS